jgi:catechol 2,3-dioxygenase-like lactoylglutathione lyase family enzyme
MIDHVCVAVTDIGKSKAFYSMALDPLGYKVQMEFDVLSKRGEDLVAFGKTPKPDFWICKGTVFQSYLHIAFSADSKEIVDRFFEAAIKAGGRDNGKPGTRPEYHPGYYGAFILDPDGYNIEVVFHDFGWVNDKQ